MLVVQVVVLSASEPYMRGEKDENLRMRERLQLEIWTLNGRVGSKSLTPIPKEVLRRGRGEVNLAKKETRCRTVSRHWRR
jgi:hypothetical protein